MGLKKSRLIFFFGALGTLLLVLTWGAGRSRWRAQPQEQAVAGVQAIPEYAPVRALVMSDLFLASFAEGPRLARLGLELGLEVLVLTRDETNEISQRPWFADAGGGDHAQAELLHGLAIPHEGMWVRDFGPLFVRRPIPGGGSGVGLVDLIYRDDTSADDRVPASLAAYWGQAIERLPVVLDGGSLLVDGRRCYVTLGKEEKAVEHEHVLREHLQARVGCAEVVVFRDAAHEHIDMWAKLVNEHTVFVNTITPQALALVRQDYGEIPPELVQLIRQLDEAAAQFAAYLKVERVPMPLPRNNLFATYANALLLNGHVVLPRYRGETKLLGRALDADLYDDYERAVAGLYRRYGYAPAWIDASDLIEVGGALHCAALQVPAVTPAARTARR